MEFTAERFILELNQHKNEADKEKMKKIFRDSDENTVCLGLHMRTVFELAKQFTEMPITEIERLLKTIITK